LVQLASQQGVRVIATGTQKDEAMLKGLSASAMVDFTAGTISNRVWQQFPNGIEGLVDLISDPAAFAELVKLIRAGGVALTTNYVADEKVLAKSNIRGGNFMLAANSGLVERLGASAANGKLKVNIQNRVPFNEAIARLQARKRARHAARH
jgi:NADPH:quinone reductase-like Zn-dependent oxidoreductase